MDKKYPLTLFRKLMALWMTKFLCEIKNNQIIFYDWGLRAYSSASYKKNITLDINKISRITYWTFRMSSRGYTYCYFIWFDKEKVWIQQSFMKGREIQDLIENLISINKKIDITWVKDFLSEKINKIDLGFDFSVPKNWSKNLEIFDQKYPEYHILLLFIFGCLWFIFLLNYLLEEILFITKEDTRIFIFFGGFFLWLGICNLLLSLIKLYGGHLYSIIFTIVWAVIIFYWIV